MDKRIKELLEQKSNMTQEEFVRKLADAFGEDYSEIDKWYAIGDNLWLRRKTTSQYLCVQVFPIMECSFLCYLHELDIGAYNLKSVERYHVNAQNIPDSLPADIRYMYPIALSQDTDVAAEIYLASTADDKDEWLYKMGIK